MSTVRVLTRYPVKSLRGDQVQVVELDERGVLGDRLWALRAADGKLGSGKSTRRFTRLPRLLEMAARDVWGVHTVVELPDGREFATVDEKVHEAVSEVVGQPVTVVRESEVPHHDAAPVHLVTDAALRWLGLGPDEWPRTRANVVVDIDGDDHPEDAWVGRHVRIGTAELRITGRTTRCAMLGDAHGLPDRPDLLTALAPRDLTLGVYATVVRPGVIGTGDPLRF